MSSGATSQRLRPFKPIRFGRYTLLMPLSTGGMGEVFLARLEGSHGFDKPCVIKKILPHLAKEQGFVSRFVDEAHILVKLQHGSIAQVLDMGVHEGAPYIALEFVDGKDLRRVLARMRERELPLPLSFVLSVMTRVLDALAYAHRKRGDDDAELNLVHRDISPQNVLISYEGEVKVIDFGLAKSTISVSNTNPQILLGKFMYMSPEQAKHGKVDKRSDLYAVGLVLWELVTGKNPFEDVPSDQLMGKVGNPEIPALNSVEPLCPQALSEAVGRALAPDAANRFQTAEEFRTRLQLILADIDPLAGAESTSRFMRDVFAPEYQQERRMLASVKEQARQMDAEAPAHPEEETMDGAMSPFAAPKLPARSIVLSGDEPTPSADRMRALNPQALSFAPTRKTNAGAGSLKKGDDHEKETLPAIAMKLEPAREEAPPMAAAPAPANSPIRARVLAKSFDNEATEAATPIIAEPEPLPSIMIAGVTDAPPTELEIPAAEFPPTPKLAPKKKPAPARVSRKLPPPERTGERPIPKSAKAAAPKPSPLPAPQRTDTMVIRNPLIDAPMASSQPSAKPVKKKGASWAWFVIPLLAVGAVGVFIAWDLQQDRQRALQDGADETSPVEVVVPKGPPPKKRAAPPPPEPVQVVEDAPEPEAPPEALPKIAEPVAPKKKVIAPTAAGGSPAVVALRQVKGDFDKLVDEDVQRQFRLRLTQLEAQAESKGDDPDFLDRIDALHQDVKAALVKQR
ncbi:MAG: protein kinase domain-containing protein [Archangium sp.]